MPYLCGVWRFANAYYNIKNKGEKNMKRILVALLCGVMMVGIVGCGTTKSSSNVKNETSSVKESEEKATSDSGEDKNSTNDTKFDENEELNDSNSVKVPIAIFDSEDYDHKADSFKKVGYLRVPNDCVVDFDFVDENGNRDSELTGHDKAVHTMGAWNSVKDCEDNGDFDKDYVFLGTYSKADHSDSVMISSHTYTQELCDEYLDGQTFKSYMDGEVAKDGKEHFRVITVNGHEIYVQNGWNEDTEEYESGPICYYFVDDNNCLSAALIFGSEYTSDEDVDAFAQYVFRGLEITE